MDFRTKFPELNANQVKQLKRELEAVIGEDNDPNVVAALYLRKVPEADSIDLAVVHDRIETENKTKQDIKRRLREYLK